MSNSMFLFINSGRAPSRWMIRQKDPRPFGIADRFRNIGFPRGRPQGLFGQVLHGVRLNRGDDQIRLPRIVHDHIG